MKKAICGALCLLMVTSSFACSFVTQSNNSSSVSSVPVTTKHTAKTTEPPVVYAKDDVVNQFIISYNAITKSAFTEIKNGNIRTKYFAYSYGYYCELLNASDTNKICVTINETNDNAAMGVAGMRDIFHDIVITIDPSLSSDEVYRHFDNLIVRDNLEEDSILGSVLILFVPDRELSNGHSRGHIEIRAQ